MDAWSGNRGVMRVCVEREGMFSWKHFIISSKTVQGKADLALTKFPSQVVLALVSKVD